VLVIGGLEELVNEELVDEGVGESLDEVVSELLEEVMKELVDEVREELEVGGLGVEVGRVDDVGRRVVEDLGGIGGRPGIPPVVGVSTTLPSQYTVYPLRVRFFNTVLMPSVPAPLHMTRFS
jgi:hypothetical protein